MSQKPKGQLRPLSLQKTPTRPNQAGIENHTVQGGRRIPRYSKAIGAGLVALATIVGGYAIVKPRLFVDQPNDIGSVNNPFDVTFSLVNRGYLSLYFIQVYCREPLIRGVATRK